MQLTRGKKAILLLLCITISIIYLSSVSRAEPTFQDFELYYLVGLADLSVGVTDYSGSLEPINGDENFPQEVYAEGRFAVYLKGKINHKYLLTLQLDTGTEPVDDVGSLLARKMKDLSKFDPIQYYPVYGDASSIQNDVNTSGKLYVLMEGDDLQLLWGDYRPNWNESVLTAYNRNLYGFSGRVNDQTSGVKTFWSKPGTLHSVDKIRSVSHSLYYLRHAKIVQSSEVLKLEVRDETGTLVKSVPLVSGRDYQIDFLQGRIVLLRGLADLTNSSAIPQNSITPGQEVFLIAEYEYEPESVIANTSYGFRIYGNQDKLWAGGSYFKEKKANGEIYHLFGTDWTFMPWENTLVKAELAHSENTPASINVSNTGGLTYTEIPLVTDGGTKIAWNLKLDTTLPALLSEVSAVKISGSMQYKQKGFASMTEQAQNSQRALDLTLGGKVLQDYQVESKVYQKWEDGGSAVDFAAVKIQRNYQDFDLTGSLRTQKVQENGQPDLRDTIGGLKVAYYLDPNTTYFASQQLTLQKNSPTPWNNRTSVGVEFKLKDSANLLMDVSVGSLGDVARLNLNYRPSGNSGVFGEWQIEEDRFGGKTHRFSAETEIGLTEEVDFRLEYQNAMGTYADANIGLVGLAYFPNERWAINFEYTKSSLDKKLERQYDRYANIKVGDYTEDLFEQIEIDEIGLHKRDILSARVQHNSTKVKYVTNFQIGAVGGETKERQYLWKNNLKWQVDESLALMLDTDASLSIDPAADTEQERNIEGNLGIVYRPINIDNLNLFGKMTYLEHMAPEEQVNGTNPDERARVFVFDWVYDLNEHLQISQKTGYKSGALRTDRTAGDWTYSDTYLWIHRVSYDWRNGWGFFGEYRNLWNTLARDNKQGLLFGLNLDVDANTRVSAGYNFTDFNDDLTRLNYEANGLFVNLVKKW